MSLTKISALTEQQLMQLESVFEQSFSGKDLYSNMPFSDDEVVLYTADSKIVAFVMIHGSPPYEFSSGPGHYLYNLCVHPDYRNKGVATALVDFLKTTFKVLHLHHAALSEDGRTWFTKRGWAPAGIWRDLREFTWPADLVKEPESSADHLVNKMYDPVENVVYMS